MALQDLVRYLNVRNRVRYPDLAGSTDAIEIVDGKVVAQFAELTLTTTFQPVSEASRGRVVAHAAVVTARGRTGAPLSTEALFAHSRHDEEVVYLDRLCRTIHALNFVEQAPGSAQLLLDVSPRHLLLVHDHGTVFEAILGQAGLRSDQVVIQISAERAELEVLRSAFANFRSRGFRLALDHFGCGNSNIDRLWALEPELVRLDTRLVQLAEKDPKARAALPRLVQVARSHGATILFPGIDNESSFQLAREASSDWVQGTWPARRNSERPLAAS